MLRVVVDVNVLVSAAIRRSGVPAAILSAWRAGQFELVISDLLLAELRDVLARPHVARFVTRAETEELVAALELSGTFVGDPPPSERLVPGDPDDDYLVALARAGGAQVIVTGDVHLLELDLQPPAVTPREFLVRLEQLPL